VRVVVATRNRGKVRELARLLADVPSLELVGLDALPPIDEVVEDAGTFAGNAAKKAIESARATGLPAIADDSGIEVDALGGAPGVDSALYAGRHGDDTANNARLLAELADVPDGQRSARFRCVLAFADPAGALGAEVHLAHGVVEGSVLREPRGENGFGYDPLFLLRGDVRTTAELSAEEKNAVSHRAEAARAMSAFLRAYVAARGAG
jgi:XTP/dITP diphosphohydrolase